MSELLEHPPERHPKRSYLAGLFGGEATSNAGESISGSVLVA